MQTAFAVTGACEVGGSRKGPQISAMPGTSENSLRLGAGKGVGLSNKDLGKSHDLEEAWLPLKRLDLSFP